MGAWNLTCAGKVDVYDTWLIKQAFQDFFLFTRWFIATKPYYHHNTHKKNIYHISFKKIFQAY